jgi:hypothetical protein
MRDRDEQTPQKWERANFSESELSVCTFKVWL